MIAPRRFLPSMSSLLALEAVERLGSASAAANDLSLTHSAVSRQLKVLEDQIGVEILRRKGNGLVLTSSGAEYAQAVRDCLQNLARASLKIRAAGERASLNLAIRPAFGMHWLAPRLLAFTHRHPEISINLSSRLAPFDFSQETFDAAVHYGMHDWAGVSWLELAGENIIPCCKPDLLPCGEIAPADIMKLPLLHLESRPGAWEEWFEHQGHPARDLRGMLFDQYANLSAAAVLGFGVALLPDYLAEAEFVAGRLAPAWPDYMTPDGRYYLVWPEGKPKARALALLIYHLERIASKTA